MNDTATIEHIDAATAIAAAREQACTEEFDEDDDRGREPRTLVHSVTLGIPGVMLGADWDLDDLIRALETATEIVWFDDFFMGHDLAIKTAGGRFLKFAVKRPAVQS